MPKPPAEKPSVKGEESLVAEPSEMDKFRSLAKRLASVTRLELVELEDRHKGKKKQP